MVLYPVDHIKDLPIIVQERLYKLQDKCGFIPNMLHAFAHRPDYFTCFLTCYDSIADREDSHLTKIDRELIGLVVSYTNKCNYGIVAHASLLKKYSEYDVYPDQEHVKRFIEDETSMSKRHRLIFRVAKRVACVEEVDDGDLLKLEEEHRMNRKDIWDIVAFSSLIAMVNRMSLFLQIQPNVEFYSENFMRRQKLRPFTAVPFTAPFCSPTHKC